MSKLNIKHKTILPAHEALLSVDWRRNKQKGPNKTNLNKYFLLNVFVAVFIQLGLYLFFTLFKSLLQLKNIARLAISLYKHYKTTCVLITILTTKHSNYKLETTILKLFKRFYVFFL